MDFELQTHPGCSRCALPRKTRMVLAAGRVEEAHPMLRQGSSCSGYLSVQNVSCNPEWILKALEKSRETVCRSKFAPTSWTWGLRLGQRPRRVPGSQQGISMHSPIPGRVAEETKEDVAGLSCLGGVLREACQVIRRDLIVSQ